VLAQVLVAKYCDHLPLYRQAQIFARNGIDLDRLTLASWVGRACWWLRPPAELLLGTILSSPKIFADDTPVPVLDPGRGRTKTGAVGLCPGRPAMARADAAGRRLCLQREPTGRASEEPPSSQAWRRPGPLR
jgi:hypothetical protein